MLSITVHVVDLIIYCFIYKIFVEIHVDYVATTPNNAIILLIIFIVQIYILCTVKPIKIIPFSLLIYIVFFFKFEYILQYVLHSAGDINFAFFI